jgi:hypothetical protein
VAFPGISEIHEDQVDKKIIDFEEFGINEGVASGIDDLISPNLKG